MAFGRITVTQFLLYFGYIRQISKCIYFIDWFEIALRQGLIFSPMQLGFRMSPLILAQCMALKLNFEIQMYQKTVF